SDVCSSDLIRGHQGVPAPPRRLTLGRDRWGAGEPHPLGAQLRQRPVGGLPGHPGGEVQQHRGVEAVLDRVQRGRAYTVVGSDAGDLHLIHVVHPEPGHEVDAAGAAVETGVPVVVLALVEDRLDPVGVQVRVELGALGAGLAVFRPPAYEVRLLVEVLARVDVVVLGRYHVVPSLRLLPQPGGDALGNRRAALDRQRATLAEVVLYINDDKCPAHIRLLNRLPQTQPSTGWASPSSSTLSARVTFSA